MEVLEFVFGFLQTIVE